MANFKDIWNLVIRADSEGAKGALGSLASKVEKTGDAVENTFRGRMQTSLGNFAQKIPGVSGLMEKFGVTSSQAGAVLGTAVAGGAVVAGAAVEKFVAASIDEFQRQAQEVLHFKEVTGLAATEASKFVAVADDFGVAAQDLSTEIGRLNKVAETSPEKLTALGISVARNKDGAYDAQQTFLNVVDAFNATDDAAKRAAIGSAAFGKNWQSMVNLLDQGSIKLTESFASVDKFQLFDDKDLAKSEAYRHALDDLGDALRGVERSIGEALVPVLTKAANAAADFTSEADKTLKPLGGIQGTVQKVADGVFGYVKTLVDGLNPQAQWNKLVSEGKDIWNHFFGDNPSDKLAKGFDNVASSSDKTLSSIDKTTMSILQSAAAAASHKEAMDQAAESAHTYMENNQGVRDSLDAERVAEEKATKAISDHLDATQKAINDGLGLEGAYNNQADALQKYNDVMSEKVTKDKDAAEVAKDQRDASLSVREAFVATAQAQVDYATSQAALNGTTLTAVARNDVFIQSLQNTMKQLDPNDPLMIWLQNYIDRLNSIPLTATTEIGVRTSNPEALGRMGVINRYAVGGYVKAKPGGTLALIGEGGQDEVVIPVGNGYSARYSGGAESPAGTPPEWGQAGYLSHTTTVPPQSTVNYFTINALDPRAASTAVIEAIQVYERGMGPGWRT